MGSWRRRLAFCTTHSKGQTCQEWIFQATTIALDRDVTAQLRLWTADSFLLEFRQSLVTNS